MNLPLIEITAEKIFFGSPGMIVLIACLVLCGCTSTQNAQPTVQSTSPAVTTLIPTTNPPATPAATVTTQEQTTIATTIVSMTVPKIDIISVTVNSATKKLTIGNSGPKAGRIFLVLDVTIQNNDKENDFNYKDTYFTIYDKVNQEYGSAITYKFPGGLDNPLTSGSVLFKSSKTGQIVFGVLQNSNAYKFSVTDSKGNVLATVDNITAT